MRGLLPAGLVTDHIRSLVTKAEAQGTGGIDQTLLLRTLADRLRGSNGFGAFASDTLMKLGLLGTIIGFIIMLAPIARLDAADKVAMKSSMGLMSDGMAVAMYTTLAGLVGSILVRIQYYMLDAATQRVFSDAVMLTETRVTPVLERPAMMDDFGLYPREEPFDPFSVMLFKALQVVAFLFFIALLAISPDSKDGKIDSKAEFIITMDWPDNHPDDLDLFVQDPDRQHRLVPASRGRLPHARPRRPRRRQRFHPGQRQEDSLADPRGDRHRARHRRRRIHRQRLAFPGHHRPAGRGRR